MTSRIAHISLVAAFVSLAWSGTAAAATSAQIQRDAADGSIDGTYTLAEMRAADRSVSAEQREYYGWEDVYNAYVRALSSPGSKGSVVPAVPVDSNKNGMIDATEKAAAAKKTRAKRKKAGLPETAAPVTAEPRDDDNEVVAAKGPDDDAGDDGRSPLLWLIVGIPLLIVALGVWRMHRGRAGRAPKGDEFA